MSSAASAPCHSNSLPLAPALCCSCWHGRVGALSPWCPASIRSPATVPLLLGCVTQVCDYILLRRRARFSIPNTTGMTAHDESSSTVTFVAAQQSARAAGLRNDYGPHFSRSWSIHACRSPWPSEPSGQNSSHPANPTELKLSQTARRIAQTLMPTINRINHLQQTSDNSPPAQR